MQIASRQGVWNEGGTTTVVTVEMTNETGLCIRFMARSVGAGFFVSWGDGVGFRPLDGMAQFAYDAAPLSVVDYAGQLTSVMSGGFKCAVNLQRFIAPNVRGLGQRPFAYCTKLKEVCLGAVTHHFDGSFQGCTALEKYSTVSTGCCWSYVWKGCKRLRELRLGAVSQFATEDFADTPNLMDIWISNKTVAQIRQVAPSGNIAAGYGARFPWGANALCRFHGIDGIVLGNGTVL